MTIEAGIVTLKWMGKYDRRNRVALAKCPECDHDISTNEASCIHCGCPQPSGGWSRSGAGPDPSRLAIIAVGTALCLVGLLFLLFWLGSGSQRGNSTATSAGKATNGLIVGYKYRLTDEVLAFDGRDSYDAAVKAAAVNDRFGVQKLFNSGHGASLSAGTQVLVLDSGRFSMKVVKVQVLSGNRAGQAWWTYPRVSATPDCAYRNQRSNNREPSCR